MSTRLIAVTVMSVVLLSLVLMLALGGFESPSTEPNEPIQYESTHEETTAPTTPERSVMQYSNEHIQYHNELPRTGGVRLW